MGKRSPGEGNIRQLPSGNWCGQIMDGYTPEGKKKILSFTASKKSAVITMIQEYRASKEKVRELQKDLTLKAWSEQWYKDYADQVQPSTYSNYQYTLNIIQAHFGSKKLNDIFPIDVERFLRKLKEVYSDSQVSKCRAMLIQIYDAAEANELAIRNPARKARRLRAVQKNVPSQDRSAAEKKDAFTPEEIETLRKELPNDLLGNSVRLMLGTGMRVQELLALTEKDITDDGSHIIINKAVKTVDGKSTLGPPKSEGSQRTIPVPESYRAYAVYLKNHGGTPFLWTSSWKNPLYSVSSFRHKYYRMLDKLPGVRKLSPHCCRHTYVTSLQAQGVSMETIAYLAGHSNVQTTGQYLHISDATLSAAVSCLDGKEGSK